MRLYFNLRYAEGVREINKFQKDINKRAKRILWNFGDFNFFFKQSFYKIRKALRKEFKNQ